MSVQRRDFLLLAMLAGAVAAPAWAQTAPQVRAEGSGAQGAASVPDFSGI